MHTPTLFNKRITYYYYETHKPSPSNVITRAYGENVFSDAINTELPIWAICLVFVKKIACSRRTDDIIFYIRIPTHFSPYIHTHTHRNNIIRITLLLLLELLLVVIYTYLHAAE